MNFRFVSSGQALEDAALVSQTLHGNSLKPLSPANVKGTRNANLDLLIEWIRRSRIAPGMRPYSGVPLGEEDERYVIEIYDGATLKRTARNANTLVSQVADWKAYSGTTLVMTFGVWYVIVQWADAGTTTSIISNQHFHGDFIFEFYASSDFMPNVIGVVPVGSNPETDYATHPHFHCNAGGIKVVRPMGNPDTNYQWSYVSGDKFTIQRTGDIVRFFGNYSGPTSVPIYETTYNSVEELELFATFVTGVSANGILGPATIQFKNLYSYNYTKSQQVEDFGSAQSSVKVRVMQESSIVGRGYYAEATI